MERLFGVQRRHKEWKEAITPPELFTPQNEFERSKEEYQELAEGIEKYTNDPSDANAVHVAGEATDVIITMLGILSSLDFNADFLVEDKINEIFKKYDPQVHKQLREQGHDFYSAIQAQKTEYNRRRTIL